MKNSTARSRTKTLTTMKNSTARPTLDVSSGGARAYTSSVGRAVNFRTRTDPPLGYAANGVSGLRTTLPLSKLIASTDADLAQELRNFLKITPPT